MSTEIFDTILLLALPASGKSEVRKFLASFDGDACRAHFRMGETVQLDDYPYVHLMRRYDEALLDAGAPPVFFRALDDGFRDPRDWGTLVELLNEDYDDLHKRPAAPTGGAFEWLHARLDRARIAVGAPSLGTLLGPRERKHVAAALEGEAAMLVRDKWAGIPATLEGRTVVIEFARGGPDGSAMPLKAPLGYAYSLARLSDDILSRAAILYVWVTPEQSRAKNVGRTDPNDPGSILHHGVPHKVMMGDYGCDDIEHLLTVVGDGAAIPISSAATGRAFRVPLARVDNRADLTTFARANLAAWRKDDVDALLAALSQGFAALWDTSAKSSA